MYNLLILHNKIWYILYKINIISDKKKEENYKFCWLETTFASGKIINPK